VALNTIKQTITEIDLFLFFQIVKNFNIKSAFLSNQSFVNVVCRLLNAAKVEQIHRLITEFTDPV
jgi:hypothetical protein